jgi:hypothetical protein
LYDVIGIQSHMHGGTWTSERLWDVCQRFARFGAPLHFTELTILSGERGRQSARRVRDWATNDEREQWQETEVARVYTMLFSHPAVEAITWWDFSDRRAWQGAPAGLVRKDMSPKPAYQRLMQLVRRQWWTRTAGRTDAAGEFPFRGFLGQYRITVTGSPGERQRKSLVLNKGQTAQLVFRLDES